MVEERPRLPKRPVQWCSAPGGGVHGQNSAGRGKLGCWGRCLEEHGTLVYEALGFTILRSLKMRVDHEVHGMNIILGYAKRFLI